MTTWSMPTLGYLPRYTVYTKASPFPSFLSLSLFLTQSSNSIVNT